MLRAHVSYKNEFINNQVRNNGPGADVRTRESHVWKDIQDVVDNMGQWYGMGTLFKDISFNVLGVDSGLSHEVNRMIHNIPLWQAWANHIRGTSVDIAFEFGDNRMPSDQGVQCPNGVTDPRPSPAGSRGSGSSNGPQQSSQPPSLVGAGSSGSKPEPPPAQPAPKPRPDSGKPKKAPRSNLVLESPPPPVMFTDDSMSADEDEDLVTRTNEWTYPKVGANDKKLRPFKRKHIEKNGKEAVIILCLEQGSRDNPCGAFDESLIPTDSAMSLISGWEILLRRTTIYLIAWAEGIVSPKILRKYINKGNPDWVRLYRFVLLRSQTNYVNVFPTPKTFAVATCTDHDADAGIRREILEEVKMPPAVTSNSFNFLSIKSEPTIIISDLPLNWKSNHNNINDIQLVAKNWGWNNIQQYAPSTYNAKDEYLMSSKPATPLQQFLRKPVPRMK